MPELPELEVLARQLREAVVGKTIVKVDCAQPRILNLAVKDFSELAIGRIIDVGRRGKWAVLFEDDGSIWLHLGLRAELRLVPASAQAPKPVLSLVMDDGSELRMAKAFMGRASFVSSADLEERWSEQGKEPLSDEFIPRMLQLILSSKPNTTVKGVLMDQSLIAGIGNLYSDDILHAARINPLRKASSLSTDEVGALYNAIGAVLREAIADGGDSDYVDLRGQSGRYEPRVHGRDLCLVDGSPVRKIKIEGRTSYYCSSGNP